MGPKKKNAAPADAAASSEVAAATKKHLKLWAEIDALLDGDAAKRRIISDDAANLAGDDLTSCLEAAVSILEEAKETERKRKRARTEAALAKKLGMNDANDDDDDEGDEKKKRTTTMLENKAESFKRQLAQQYLSLFGGKGNWKIGKEIRDFVSSGTLPERFASRLNTAANDSAYTTASFALVKQDGQPTAGDFAALGEMMFAEACANVMVLYAAYHREVFEHQRWASEAALDASIAENATLLRALALRDAQGLKIQDGKSWMIGDMFGAKTHPPAATANMAAAPARAAASDVGARPDWTKGTPKVKLTGTTCKTCKGHGLSRVLLFCFNRTQGLKVYIVITKEME